MGSELNVTPDFWCSTVQRKHQASLFVLASSAAGRGVGGGQEGSQSTSVQQVADKVQKSCKTGFPSQVSSDPRGLVLKCAGGLEWEPQTQKVTQGYALERGGRGWEDQRKSHGWGSHWGGGFAWIPNEGEKLPGMYLVDVPALFPCINNLNAKMETMCCFKPVIVIINLVDVYLQASSLHQWIPEDTPRTNGSEFSGTKGGQQAHARGRKWLPLHRTKVF